MEPLGERFGDGRVAHAVELGLLAVILRYRCDIGAGRILGRDCVCREGIAAGLRKGGLDADRIGRLKIAARDLVVGGERLVDIRAESPVDDARRGASTIEQHLKPRHVLASAKR